MVGFASLPRKLETTSLKTLPDYLEHGLDVVFVGINPGAYSAEVGHYFATPQNRFWPAVNRSGLLTGPLDASTDHLALAQRIGFTDLVKRPSNSASSCVSPTIGQARPFSKRSYSNIGRSSSASRA